MIGDNHYDLTGVFQVLGMMPMVKMSMSKDTTTSAGTDHGDLVSGRQAAEVHTTSGMSSCALLLRLLFPVKRFYLDGVHGEEHHQRRRSLQRLPPCPSGCCFQLSGST